MELFIYFALFTSLAITTMVKIAGEKKKSEALKKISWATNLPLKKTKTIGFSCQSDDYKGMKVTITLQYYERKNQEQNLYMSRLKKEHCLLIEVRPHKPLDSKFIIRNNMEYTVFLDKMKKAKTIRTGDELFDERFRLECENQSNTRGLLNKQVRESLYLLGNTFSDICVRNHRIRCAKKYHPNTAEKDVSTALPLLEGIIASFSDTRSDYDRLSDILFKDSHRSVQSLCLNTLVESFEQAELKKKYLHNLLENQHPWIRIEAVFQLCRLGEHVKEYIIPFLSSTEDHLIKRSVYIAGQIKDKTFYPFLKHIYETTSDKEIKTEIIKALPGVSETLVPTGDISAFFVTLLEDDLPETELSIAVSLLHRCGTVEAVIPLMEAARKIWNPQLKHRIREAIARIQSRIKNGEKGHISLAENDDSGSLSIPPCP